VSGFHQRLAEVAQVYPLAAGEGLAAIAQQRNAQGFERRRHTPSRGNRWRRPGIELQYIQVPDNGFPQVLWRQWVHGPGTGRQATWRHAQMAFRMPKVLIF